jgi:ubiquinone/menaquinone biosynthesis C-methylase UbiE
MARRRLEPRDLQGRLLEVACGRGGFASWLAGQTDAEVAAFDLSFVAVRAGRDHASALGRAPRFGVCDVEALPFAAERFDSVFCFETIEHVPSPRRALAELARVLRRGGRLFLSTPNYFNVWLLYRVYLRLLGRRFTEAGQPINQPLLLPLTHAWVRAAGLRVCHVESTGFPWPRGQGRPALESAWLRHLPFSRWSGQQSLIVAERER